VTPDRLGVLRAPAEPVRLVPLVQNTATALPPSSSRWRWRIGGTPRNLSRSSADLPGALPRWSGNAGSSPVAPVYIRMRLGWLLATLSKRCYAAGNVPRGRERSGRSHAVPARVLLTRSFALTTSTWRLSNSFSWSFPGSLAERARRAQESLAGSRGKSLQALHSCRTRRLYGV
jgi:hypothetical protein